MRTVTSELMQWENGGYFVLRPEIFDALRRRRGPGAADAFARLLSADKLLLAQPLHGFLAAADTVQGPGRAGGLFQQGARPVDGVDTAPSDDGPASGPCAERADRRGLRPVTARCRCRRPVGRRCSAAHPDDIEIAAGGHAARAGRRRARRSASTTSLLTGRRERQAEARPPRPPFLPGAELTFGLHELPDGAPARRTGARSKAGHARPARPGSP